MDMNCTRRTERKEPTMSSLGPLEITTPTEREIAIRRRFRASRSLVWEAHTRPELLRRWLIGPPGWEMQICEVDLKVGGRFRYGWKKDDGTIMAMGGEYLEIEAPERIVSTELFDEDWTGGTAVSTLRLTEDEGVTTLLNTILYASREARDGALKSGMDQGMEYGYSKLEKLLDEVG
jgi:uncharacterized protein YndB with AHSA1/START domain